MNINPSSTGRHGDQPSREETLFHAARLLSRPEERAAFLDLVCADEPELRERVEQLFAARAQADAFFDASPGMSVAAPPAIPAIPDQPAAASALTGHDLPGRIGRYKLLQKIGEGGCGVVYMAEQEEPVRRQVALKVIKLGMDTRSVINRFEAERQALALMDHPNIAKVLDAGATETGRPYFVMELVRGVKITEYCDQARLTLRDRLELFIKVCQAIQHAHQKAVIHRDIKPSNILVTLHDGVPVPKVIDFGIAKATQGKLTDQTLFTAFEQFIGTPAYMSPEQAEMSGLDIDTRSDIYSLGVLLYELLTGSTPFDTKELLHSGLDHMRQIIREREPVRPSTRLRQTTSAASPSQLVTRHSSLVTDLDWIVMKCLEKDRRRRYETANGLAADLWRHLTHEPVVARPPSAAYKLQKAFRRNKVIYSAAGFVATALVVGLAVSFWQASVALRARQQADDARLAEAQERRAAQSAQAVAERERANAQQIADDLLETLYAADIRAAYRAIQVNDFALATDLLGKYRPYAPIGDFAPFVGKTEPMARPPDLLGWEWRWLWQLCRSDELDTLQSTPNVVPRPVLALHDRLLVTASDRWLRVIDQNSMEVIATLGGPEEFDSFIDLGAVAFSGDGRYLAVKGGTSVRVWRVGQWQSSYKQLEGSANFSMNSAVVFSPDSRTLATRVAGGIGFWDTETWSMTLLPAPERLGTMMKYSRGGALLAMDLWDRTSNSGHLQIRDARTFGLITNLVRSPSPARGKGIPSLVTTANVTGAASARERRGVPRDAMYLRVVAADFSDRFLAVGYRDGEFKLFDLSTWAEVISVHAHPSFLFGLAFSPDGCVLATGGKDQVIKIWDVTALTASMGSGPAPKPVKELRGHHGSILALAFVPDGKKLLSASYDGSVKVWDPFGADPPSGLPDEYRAVWFSPDARRLITQPHGAGGELNLWDTVTRVKLGPAVPATEGSGYAVGTVSDDGQRVALGTAGGVIDVWNLQTRQCDGRLETGAELSTHQLDFSPGGGWLAAAPGMLHHSTSEGGLRLWNLESGAHSPIIFHQAFAPFAFCSDDRRMVFARIDGIVEVADFHGEVRLAQWKAHAAPIYSLALSPDNRLLATGSEDAMVRVWHMASYEKILELKGHLTGISAMAFAPDGKTLVTVTWDSTVKFWHIATGRELFTVDQFRMVRWSARFSPNGEYLAISGDDDSGQRQLMLWRAPSWQEIETAEAKRKQN